MPRSPGRVALACALASVIGCGDDAPPPAPARTTIVVQPADARIATTVRPLVPLLEACYGLPVRLAVAAPVDAVRVDGLSADASAALLALGDALPAEAAAFVAVVRTPLRAAAGPESRRVFGLGEAAPRTAVVSLARFLALSPPDPNARADVAQAGVDRDRLATVLLHEVGHALGLAHCDDSRCLMHDAATLAALDALALTPCDRCFPRFCAIRDADPVARRAAVAAVAEPLGLAAPVPTAVAEAPR